MGELNNNYFTIKGHNSALTINISGYENDNAADFYDKNWLNAEAKIDTPPFKGVFEFSLTTMNLNNFYKYLLDFTAVDKSIDQISFNTLEDDISINLLKNSLGHVQINGLIKPYIGESKLEIAFDSDLTYMEDLKKRLKSIVQKFPIKK